MSLAWYFNGRKYNTTKTDKLCITPGSLKSHIFTPTISVDLVAFHLTAYKAVDAAKKSVS